MTGEDVDEREFNRFLEGKSPLNAAYRAGRDESAPSELGAAIRARAEAAVGGRRARRGWMLDRPVAWAAVIVVCAGLTLLMAPDRRPETVPGELTEIAEPVPAPARSTPAAADAPSSASVDVTKRSETARQAPGYGSPLAVDDAGSPSRVAGSDLDGVNRNARAPAQPRVGDDETAILAAPPVAPRARRAAEADQSRTKVSGAVISEPTSGGPPGLKLGDPFAAVRRLVAAGDLQAARLALAAVRAEYPAMTDQEVAAALGPVWTKLKRED